MADNYNRLKADIANALSAEFNQGVRDIPPVIINGGTVGRSFTVRRKGSTEDDSGSWHTTAVYGDMTFVGTRVGARKLKDDMRQFIFCFSTHLESKGGGMAEYEVEAPYSTLVKKLGPEFEEAILKVMGKTFPELCEMMEEHGATARAHAAAGTKPKIEDIVKPQHLNIVGWGRWKFGQAIP